MNNKKIKIAASIVTCNPEIKRLLENFNAVKTQVEAILVIDNGSSNAFEFSNLTGACFIKNTENKGIAWALNCAFDWAYEKGFEWLLTLDQDSRVTEGFVESLLGEVSSKRSTKIGIVSSVFEMRKYQDLRKKENIFLKVMRFIQEKTHKGLPITSGVLNNVKAVREINGVDEELFIDGVDFELDLKLRKNGYKIIQCSNAVLEHEIGHPKRLNTSINIVSTGHPAWRYYYMYRNKVKLHKYFFVAPIYFIFDDIFSLLKIPLFWFCSERLKVRAMLTGLKDGVLRHRRCYNDVRSVFDTEL